MIYHNKAESAHLFVLAAAYASCTALQGPFPVNITQ